MEQVRLELTLCIDKRRQNQKRIAQQLARQPRRQWVPPVKTELDWFLQCIPKKEERKVLRLSPEFQELYMALGKLLEAYLN